jgi:hypothetical protein
MEEIENSVNIQKNDLRNDKKQFHVFNKYFNSIVCNLCVKKLKSKNSFWYHIRSKIHLDNLKKNFDTRYHYKFNKFKNVYGDDLLHQVSFRICIKKKIQFERKFLIQCIRSNQIIFSKNFFSCRIILNPERMLLNSTSVNIFNTNNRQSLKFSLYSLNLKIIQFFTN